jgi:hypothetical protein
MATTSRLDATRRSLRTVRFGIGAVAAAGLAVFGIAARASHPGASAPVSRSQATSASSAASEDDTTQAFGFGGGSIGSGTDAPSVQSGAS